MFLIASYYTAVIKLPRISRVTEEQEARTVEGRRLVRVLAAAVWAVTALGCVEEGVDIRIQLGNPLARHQESCQVKQIHKHFVAVAKGKENHLVNIYS